MDMEIEGYVIITEYDRSDLYTKVKDYSKKGYILEGFSTTIDELDDIAFHQVMVKYKEKQKESL